MHLMMMAGLRGGVGPHGGLYEVQRGVHNELVEVREIVLRRRAQLHLVHRVRASHDDEHDHGRSGRQEEEEMGGVQGAS